MIFLKLSGRLGNQLFQLAFASIISYKFNKRIFLIPCEQYGICLINIKASRVVPWTNFKLYLRAVSYLDKRINIKNKIEIKSCFENNFIDKNIQFPLRIEGYFQDGKFFSCWKQIVLNNISIQKNVINRFHLKYPWVGASRILLINLRLQEYSYVKFKEIEAVAALPVFWYLNLLKELPLKTFDKIVVISDDIIEAKNLLGMDCSEFIFINDDYIMDFLFLMESDVLIIPNSSFSWWGAFLNKKTHKKVYAPKNWVGYNVGIEYPTGIMIDEFIWID
ncbi:alpha-1,2-fucosyltransferase [Algoriphagus formosus]|uniref:Alpha-1,2-fucosyltransferase n=1 Tax=Algoriphagus formosus TaxID=2007308 RepID=A0A4R5UVR7_9BACT|nr:alpha-1,2-fucosyltransferase [Algoriphagus aquimaris]TDK43319.1 hypothetical protein E1898_11960 [Algoriphagus aquimaris]